MLEINVSYIQFNLAQSNKVLYSQRYKYDNINALRIYVQLILFVAILNYAVATNLAKHLTHFSKYSEIWFKSWELNAEDTQTLYRLFAELYLKNNDYTTAVSYLSLYLKTLPTEVSLSKEIEFFLTTAVVKAIKSPVGSYSTRVSLLEVTYIFIIRRLFILSFFFFNASIV